MPMTANCCVEALSILGIAWGSSRLWMRALRWVSLWAYEQGDPIEAKQQPGVCVSITTASPVDRPCVAVVSRGCAGGGQRPAWATLASQ